jgi:lipoate-protein ligase A
MILFNHSYNTPKENLAIDEALLRLVDTGHYQEGICRIWESMDHFVVLGLSKKIDDDVHLEACKRDGIPILKRCSGGGTVLQGPGCFNYGFILPMNYNLDLAGIGTTTSCILSMVQERLEPMISKTEQRGISDLVINNIKFSGNAQRRLKNAILFHGTILYDFDLSLISTYLKEPPIQPDYRKKRPHHQFIRNVSASHSALMGAFIAKTNDTMQIHEDLLPVELVNKYQPMA